MLRDAFRRHIECRFLAEGDLVHVHNTARLWSQIQQFAEGHEDEPVIGVITRFTDSRVVVALLHPLEGEVYRAAKNIE